jgi:hypothetical protein
MPLKANDARSAAIGQHGRQIAASRSRARAALRRVVAGAELLSTGGLDALPPAERTALWRALAPLLDEAPELDKVS